ncbi:pyruvate kinase [Methanocella arvoryzae]|uniref:Pyruvate kinase n=1 Tax=Methanocella arvoryzae (strain DSM 22066 / NBRC 105507 / MRE50) TaxID=351160 RepID=Q0W8N0_METAR|nr:pyruvate kinase [Methanocella arvoryzae]CAH04801.1 pyruvate kinase (PyK) [uncultured archaeon]CAJ35263.1 pyruvate kinase (pyruvate phosphotransferase) [Methanocella arvoryzae MRE50]
MRKTKIVCTIGPACDSQDMLEKLAVAGMNVARLNMSHADHEHTVQTINNIRMVSEAIGKPIGILMDLQGPKIRVGTLQQPANLKPGGTFTLTTRDVPGDSQEVNVPFKELPQSVSTGQTLLLDDGLIELKVDAVTETDIRTKVVRGGELKSKKGINLPQSTIRIPSITEKDVRDLEFGIEHEVDMIAMSFVRKPQDVLDLRKKIEDNDSDIPIISKIEKHEAVKNIDGIIDVVDGVMVARGDLGIEIPMAEVPIVQKMIISKCIARGIPVITATQMLDSMIRNPIPTRAEATDVANAVFDGTDALMLSGETAFGEYPVKAVETMARIAKYTEESTYYKHAIAAKAPKPSLSMTDAVAQSTTESARVLKAQAIITATQTGYSARKVSKYRPQLPILAVTNDPKVVNRLTLSWAVLPLLIGSPGNLDELIQDSVDACLQKGYVKNGDLVVITAGVMTGIPGGTNIMKIHVVAKELARGIGVGKDIVKGVARVIKSPSEFTNIRSGDILVIKEVDVDHIDDVKPARAIISEETGLTSYSAIIGRELNIPVVVGIKNATRIIQDGSTITVDSVRGMVYEGSINLPGE